MTRAEIDANVFMQLDGLRLAIAAMAAALPPSTRGSAQQLAETLPMAEGMRRESLDLAHAALSQPAASAAS